MNTPGRIEITAPNVRVHFEKRTHNPILKEAGFEEPTAPVPWMRGKSLQLEFP